MEGIYFIVVPARSSPIELKAKLLCQGATADQEVQALFQMQNPSKTRRGGLSSGGRIKLGEGLLVNFPFYERRETDLRVTKDPIRRFGVLIEERGVIVAKADVLQAPEWYNQEAGGFPITRILTAHNRQLATSVYEDCSLFKTGQECRFCVINRSLTDKPPELVLKSPELILAALRRIPVEEYGGLTINGGMTFSPARGIELISPVVEAIRSAYPQLPIAVEITPPSDLMWVDRIVAAGVSSLMMNLETWDMGLRRKLLPGKDIYCARDQYLSALGRAIELLGAGKASTCFVVGTEPLESLKAGISEVVSRGIIPSPLAGRYFEDIPDYPFVPDVNWKDFLGLIRFTAGEMLKKGLLSTDKVGCVACGMCDLTRDAMP